MLVSYRRERAPTTPEFALRTLGLPDDLDVQTLSLRPESLSSRMRFVAQRPSLSEKTTDQWLREGVTPVRSRRLVVARPSRPSSS